MDNRYSTNELKAVLQDGMRRTYDDEASYHYAEDLDFLDDLTLGDLTDEKRRSFVEHLASCSYCRSEIAAMVKAGVLDFSLAPSVQEERKPSLEASSKWRGWLRTASFVTAAICVLVTGSVYYLMHDKGGGQIAVGPNQDTEPTSVAAPPELMPHSIFDYSYPDPGAKAFGMTLSPENEKKYKEFREKIKTQPEDAQLRIAFGKFFLELEESDPASAYSQFKKASELDSKNYNTFSELGAAAFMSRKYDEAIAAFEKVLEKYPNDLTTLLNLGRCYAEKGDKEKAKEFFGRARPMIKDEKVRQRLDRMMEYSPPQEDQE